MATTTQYTNLTNVPDNLGINGIEKLTSEVSFDDWNFLVETELFRVNVLEVIDYNKARPALDSASYIKWRQISANVGAWLKTQVSMDLIKNVRNASSEFNFADDVYKSIKVYCKGEGTTKMGWNSLINLMEGRRTRYPTPEAFVTALRSNYADLKNADIGFTPGMAMILLIKDLSSELTSWVTVKQQSMSHPKEIRDEDFYKYCAEAISEASQYQANLSALNATWKQPGNARNNKPKKDDDKKSFNDKKEDLNTPVNTEGPPPGVDIEAHVKVMMAIRARGKCGYCQLKGHNASKCFYLVDNPPEGWNPKPDIWCYSRAKSAQKKPRKTSTNVSGAAVENYYLDNFIGATMSANLASDLQESNGPWIAPRTYAPDDIHETYEPDEILDQDADPHTNNKEGIIENLCASSSTNRIKPGQFIADSGSGTNIAGDFATFVQYEEFTSEEKAYRFTCSNGTSGIAKGRGTLMMRLEKGNGVVTDILLIAYYVPGLAFNLWSCERSKADHDIWHCSKDNTIRRLSDDAILGYTRTVEGIAVVDTGDAKEELQHRALSLSAVPPLLQHRRLAHTNDILRRNTERESDLDESSGRIEHCEAVDSAKHIG